jgi:hypothetical protein
MDSLNDLCARVAVIYSQLHQSGTVGKNQEVVPRRNAALGPARKRGKLQSVARYRSKVSHRHTYSGPRSFQEEYHEWTDHTHSNDHGTVLGGCLAGRHLNAGTRKSSPSAVTWNASEGLDQAHPQCWDPQEAGRSTCLHKRLSDLYGLGCQRCPASLRDLYRIGEQEDYVLESVAEVLNSINSSN